MASGQPRSRVEWPNVAFACQRSTERASFLSNNNELRENALPASAFQHTGAISSDFTTLFRCFLIGLIQGFFFFQGLNYEGFSRMERYEMCMAFYE